MTVELRISHRSGKDPGEVNPDTSYVYKLVAQELNPDGSRNKYIGITTRDMARYMEEVEDDFRSIEYSGKPRRFLTPPIHTILYRCKTWKELQIREILCIKVLRKMEGKNLLNRTEGGEPGERRKWESSMCFTPPQLEIVQALVEDTICTPSQTLPSVFNYLVQRASKYPGVDVELEMFLSHMAKECLTVQGAEARIFRLPTVILPPTPAINPPIAHPTQLELFDTSQPNLEQPVVVKKKPGRPPTLLKCSKFNKDPNDPCTKDKHGVEGKIHGRGLCHRHHDRRRRLENKAAEEQKASWTVVATSPAPTILTQRGWVLLQHNDAKGSTLGGTK